MMRRLLCQLVIFVFVAWQGELLSQVSLKQPLERYAYQCERALRELDCRGCSIAIVKDDQVIFVEGFGARRQSTQQFVDSHTLFAIGSITKGMVTALLDMAVKEGKLGWEDPVTRYLPGFRMYDGYVGREMIVRDLLTHRSGLRDHAGDLLFLNKTHEEMIQGLRKISPATEFRTAFAYQNIMYLAAGDLLEKVRGVSWHHLVKEQIFDPLGMKESYPLLKRFPSSNNIAIGHLPISGEWLEVEWAEQIDFGPAGSVVSNAWEMAQWLRVLLKGGALPQGEWELSSLVEPHIFLPMSGWIERLYRSAHFMGCGMGWFSYDYFGHRVVEHSGNLPGLSAKLAFIPEIQLGVVVMCNQHESLLPHALIMQAFDAFLNTGKVDWIHRMALITPEMKERKPIDRRVVDVLNPLSFSGIYIHPVIGEVGVRVEGSRLVLDYGPNAVGELSSLGGDRFQILWQQVIPRLFPGELTVRFNRDESGGIAAMIIEGLAEFVRS